MLFTSTKQRFIVRQGSRKRYRYTGMEKNEETGLSYHSARYYPSWLGGWDRPDPIGLGDGENRWAYVRGNPISTVDPSGMGTVSVEEYAWNSSEANAIISGLQSSGDLSPDRGRALAELADAASPEFGYLLRHALGASLG